MGKERRFADGSVRILSEGDKFTIRGYGAVFDKPSQVLRAQGVGDFIETIDKSAFDGVLNDPYILILSNHDSRMVLGRTGAGTAKIGVDEVGLWYEVHAPATRADVVESIQRGDMFGSSFGFDIDIEEWEPGEEGVAKRRLKRFKKVYDTGPVSYPAYLDTSTGVDMDQAARNYRSYLERVDEQRKEGYSNLCSYKLRLMEHSFTI